MVITKNFMTLAYTLGAFSSDGLFEEKRFCTHTESLNKESDKDRKFIAGTVNTYFKSGRVSFQRRPASEALHGRRFH